MDSIHDSTVFFSSSPKPSISSNSSLTKYFRRLFEHISSGNFLECVATCSFWLFYYNTRDAPAARESGDEIGPMPTERHTSKPNKIYEFQLIWERNLESIINFFVTEKIIDSIKFYCQWKKTMKYSIINKTAVTKITIGLGYVLR